MAKEPDFIIAGTQKCATSWVFECLDEHPGVYMPETDSLDYFSTKHQRNREWYEEHFREADTGQVVGEESPTYIREEKAPERIKEHFGQDVKLIFILRNPVDRAFSHYWHHKSRGETNREFEECLEWYDPFSEWVKPGFYKRHLERYFQEFDEEQIKVMIFDDLVESDEDFIREIYRFIDVDDAYRPSKLDEKVNDASYDWMSLYRRPKNLLKESLPEEVIKVLFPVHKTIKSSFTDKSEYEEGMKEETREELEKIYLEDVKGLSDLLNRDLTHWVNSE